MGDLHDLADRLESVEGDSYWPAPSEPMVVARRIVEARQRDDVTLLRRWRGDWMEWDHGAWFAAEEDAVRSMLYSTLENVNYFATAGPKPWAPTRRKIADVADALSAVTHLSETVDPPEWIGSTEGPPARELVVARNGILHVTARTLIDHDPNLFNTVRVPFDYDPDTPEPTRWLTFLNQLWPDDPESIAALQEWIGYVLSGRTDLHKILLLVGPTRAGKGVLGRVLGALVGRGNVAGPTLASLGTNFGLQPLIGKPLAIISDARLGNAHGVNQIVERLLSISGEDWLTIDRKYKEPWSGKLNARFLIISNELPRFGDASGAIANRFVLLTLRRSWLGEENTSLTDELLTELPGILVWALDGLDHLNRKGSFTEPAASKEAILALQDLISPVSAFVRDWCVVGPQHEITTDALFAAWKDWCEQNGRSRPGSKAVFGRDLLAAYPTIRKTRPHEDDRRVYVYQGIALTPQSSGPWTNPDQEPETPTVQAGPSTRALSPPSEWVQDFTGGDEPTITVNGETVELPLPEDQLPDAFAPPKTTGRTR